MAAEDRATTELLADLWDLVEGWSSGAIQRARQADATGPSEVEDAEIRLLVAHAAELRGVVEAHLAAEETAAAPEQVPEPGAGPTSESVAVAAPEVGAEMAGVGVATVRVPASSHACNSADFDRPPCVECGGRHWHCSICGARRDDCSAAS